MNQPAKAQEPSMEEILASIRRIIADDDSKPPPRPQPAAAAPKPAAPPPRPVMPPPRPVMPPPEPVPQYPDEMLAQMEPPPAPEPESQDILDLTEQMAQIATEPPSFQTIDGQSDVIFADPQPEPPPPPPRPAQAPPQSYAPPPPAGDLLSASTTAAVDSAFNALAQTVLVQNARTLEDLVREMLRPMLKSWLDDNLPGMVERIVKAEIERVARGR
jgi:cell pole-organizing protein PopZ